MCKHLREYKELEKRLNGFADYIGAHSEFSDRGQWDSPCKYCFKEVFDQVPWHMLVREMFRR